METTRNFNIDLLRIIAMFGIVFIHSFSFGNLLGACGSYTMQGVLSTILFTFLYSMTNVFVIISAWYLPDSTFSWRKVAKIMAVASGYSIIIYLLLCVFGRVVFNPIDFVKCVLSLLANQYWFITAYVIMYALSPYINDLLGRMDEKRLRGLCLTLLSFFCLIPTFLFFVPGQSLADSSNGQGFVWFLALYCLVYYIKKYRKEWLLSVSIAKYVMIALACILFLVASKYGLTYVSERMGNGGSGNMRFFFNSSLPVMAISFCSFFVAMKLPGIKSFTTVISSVAATTLGIYIIHAQPTLNGILWGDIYSLLKAYPSFALLLDLSVVTIVFLSSMAIETIRIKLSN